MHRLTNRTVGGRSGLQSSELRDDVNKPASPVKADRKEQIADRLSKADDERSRVQARIVELVEDKYFNYRSRLSGAALHFARNIGKGAVFVGGVTNVYDIHYGIYQRSGQNREAGGHSHPSRAESLITNPTLVGGMVGAVGGIAVSALDKSSPLHNEPIIKQIVEMLDKEFGPNKKYESMISGYIKRTEFQKQGGDPIENKHLSQINVIITSERANKAVKKLAQQLSSLASAHGCSLDEIEKRYGEIYYGINMHVTGCDEDGNEIKGMQKIKEEDAKKLLDLIIPIKIHVEKFADAPDPLK